MIQYPVTVTAVVLHSEVEGILEFAMNDTLRLSAYFSGESFRPGEHFEATISHLSYDLEWDVIFSKNVEKLKQLEPAPGLCAY